MISVAFASDGTLASLGKDGTMRLWKVGKSGATPLGEPLKLVKPIEIEEPLRGFDDIPSTAFAPDGKLVSKNFDGTLWLWHLNVESWLEAACRRANRNLSLAEWRKYMTDETYRLTCPDLPPGEGTAEKGSSREGPSAQ